MSKPTPGPWETYGDGLGIRTKVNGFRIVKCDQANRNAYENAAERAEGLETVKANARLIAAAPDLYEAVRIAKQLASIASDWNLSEVEIDGEMVSTYDLAEKFAAALAKAESHS